MDYKMRNELGTVSVTDQVIAMVAGNSALECYGIVAMCAKRAKDGIVEMFKKENLTKGIKVSVNEDSVTIHLFIVVEYGVSIAAVAKTVMETVKYHVETYTGVKVEKVNVSVEGIRV